MVASVVQVLTSAGLQFVLFGLASRSLDAEAFGVWTVAATLNLLPSLADFGIVKSATALIASSAGSHGRVHRVVSTAFFLQSAVCAAACVTLVPMAGWLDRLDLCLSAVASLVFVLGLGALLRVWLGPAVTLPSSSVWCWLVGASAVQTLATLFWSVFYGVGKTRLPKRFALLSTAMGLLAGPSAGSWLGAEGLAAILCLIPLFCQLLPLAFRSWPIVSEVK